MWTQHSKISKLVVCTLPKVSLASQGARHHVTTLGGRLYAFHCIQAEEEVEEHLAGRWISSRARPRVVAAWIRGGQPVRGRCRAVKYLFQRCGIQRPMASYFRQGVRG